MNLRNSKTTFCSVGLLLVALAPLDASTRSHKRYRSTSPAHDVRAVIKEEILAPIATQMDETIASLAEGTQSLVHAVGTGVAVEAAAAMQENHVALSAAVIKAIDDGFNKAVTELTAEHATAPTASAPNAEDRTTALKWLGENLIVGLESKTAGALVQPTEPSNSLILGKAFGAQLGSEIAAIFNTPTAPSDESSVTIEVSTTSDVPRPTRRQRTAATTSTETVESIKPNIVLPATFIQSRPAQEVKNVLRGLDDAARTKIAAYILKEGISSCAGQYELAPELALEAFYHDCSKPNPKWNLLIHDIILDEAEAPKSTLHKAASKAASAIAWARGKPTALQTAIATNDLVAVFKLHINEPESFFAEVNAHGLDDMNDTTETMRNLVDALFAQVKQVLGKE